MNADVTRDMTFASGACVALRLLVAASFLCFMRSAFPDDAKGYTDIAGEAVKQELVQRTPRGLSENQSAEIAGRYGPSAVPALVGMLKDPGSDPGPQGMACLVLAKMPGTEGRDAVIAYVRERLAAGELTRDQADWLNVSMVAIGQMADEVSLRFLEEIAGRSYWELPRVPPVIHQNSRGEESISGDQARLYLRETAMSSGLGNVPRGRQTEALDILRRLKAGDASDMAKTIDFRIADMEKRIASEEQPPSNNVTP